MLYVSRWQRELGAQRVARALDQPRELLVRRLWVRVARRRLLAQRLLGGHVVADPPVQALDVRGQVVQGIDVSVVVSDLAVSFTLVAVTVRLTAEEVV